ncbi:hypothetical protein BC833DRAFT_621055 [Globomyces pollinis-pini]|nr:hypothetical protein BC833DRAFT_621055 [Globomyces pollinis-pini]
MFNSTHTIVNQDSTDYSSNDEELPDHHTYLKVLIHSSSLATVNVIPTKWEPIWLRFLIKPPHKKSKSRDVKDVPKTHWDMHKIHRQMREEGFWKYQPSDD